MQLQVRQNISIASKLQEEAAKSAVNKAVMPMRDYDEDVHNL